MKKFIHVDMDAFYASVEQRDNPELRGKPIAVGGSTKGRGVVAAASYEARAYGVRSAMPSRQAAQKCPNLIFVRGRMDVYREVSAQIHAIFRRYTDAIEPLSLDEAYLDVTDNKKDIVFASQVAREIRQQIFDELHLTASAGVAPVKFLAKIASDYNKPNGQTVIQPHEVLDFVAQLPVGAFYGVGTKTQERMHKLGIRTGLDLRNTPLETLRAHFGKHGQWYYNLARGIDTRNVQTSRARKSIGAERTFAQDKEGVDACFEPIQSILTRIDSTLQRKHMGFRTLTLKVRYHDFTTITRSTTCSDLQSSASALAHKVHNLLLNKTEADSRPVRLLGVSVSKLQSLEPATSGGPEGESRTEPQTKVAESAQKYLF